MTRAALWLAAALALSGAPAFAEEHHKLLRQVPVAISACVSHHASAAPTGEALVAHHFSRLAEVFVGRGKATVVRLSTHQGKPQCTIVGIDATEQQMDLLAQPWIRGGDAKTTDPFGPLMNKAWRNSVDGKTHFLIGLTAQQDIAGIKGAAIVVRED
ncbi:MAG: hypothetical protein AAGA28_09510 [Pseudomonadota bacterium]